MKNIILLAVQGAGKGSLAKVLKEKYGYAHISTGDILRERAAVGDELGKQIKDMMDSGKLVSNDILFQALEYKINTPECENGYILDGFPRNMEQALGYDEMLKNLNKDIGIVLNLTLPEDQLYQRIVGRRMCKDCGAIYNIYSDELRPKVDGKCNTCGGQLYQRDDDNEAAMKTRIETYYKVTSPLIDFYKEKGILYEVDSTVLAETVKAVENIISELGE